MANNTQFSKVGFLKSYLLPVLIIFLIPGFGLWFFNHVEKHHDLEIRSKLLSQIRADKNLTVEERSRANEFYGKIFVSRILASDNPEAKEIQKSFAPVQTRYTVFRWMQRTSLICLVTGVAAFIAVGIGVIFSFRSQTAQYWSLRLGWYVLRWFALIQVVGQGALVVALSFWVTAFWMESYSVKLIAIAGLLAGVAVLALVAAIFRKVSTENEFEGVLLTKEAAPSLWQRVLEMTQKMNIAPPDYILAGIDDNFFVTEHPVKIGEERLQGRTLFISLSLLKVLSRDEADAVLGHEMAHFSGEDTLYSKRISPLLGKYADYLEALYQGGISRPVFHFMMFFWNLYQISINKLRREREFRADRIGAEVTSSQHMANALIKVISYCRYRNKIQEMLFNKEENQETMDVSARIEKGFSAFKADCVTDKDLTDSVTPHPFDSHPPLASRLQSLGFDPVTALRTVTAVPALDDSWFSTIERAAEVEASQWNAFEQRFQKAHDQSLAWRYKPEGEMQIQHVVKYFPAIQFSTAKGVTATLDYEKLRLSDWNDPVVLSTITACRIDDNLGGKKLIIDYKPEPEGKKQSQKVKFEDFKAPDADFLKSFERYYGRSLTAKKYLEAKAAEEASASALKK